MGILAKIGMFIWELIKTWLSLFYAPLKDTDMLWVIIPIYLTWLFTEFFQEKKGTSMGNATSNAVVVLWAAVDWTRTSVNFYRDSIITFWNLIAKFLLSIIVLAYGAFIVMQGVKGRNLTQYIGRIRVVTYIVIMITPLVYDTISFSLNVILSIILFFPVFYYSVELFDRFTPDPEPIKEQGKSNSGGFGERGDFTI